MSAGDRYLLKVLTFVQRRWRSGGGLAREGAPQSSAGNSEADQSRLQSITIRLSDVQSDSECSRGEVITVLDGASLVKAREKLLEFFFLCKRNRFYSTRSLGPVPFYNIVQVHLELTPCCYIIDVLRIFSR